jgi:NO-binding membrane sensor protein with MHYT domain
MMTRRKVISLWVKLYGPTEVSLSTSKALRHRHTVMTDRARSRGDDWTVEVKPTRIVNLGLTEKTDCDRPNRHSISGVAVLRVWNCLSVQHDWSFVVLAGLVCLLTSISAMNLFQRAQAGKRRPRLMWLLAAGFATGTGAWATHFIAMLAYKPGFAIEFNLTITFLSLAVSVVMMTTGFAAALFSDGKKGIVAGGAMLGIGIACMHYLGMAALGDHTEIVWIPGYIFASVLLSVAFSVVSLLLARRGDTPRQLAAASAFLTLAIVSLHFVSMSAIDTIRARAFIADGDLLSQHVMAWAVAAIATTVVVGGWISAMSDRWAGRIIDERSMQLDAAVNNMAQGLCMFDHNGRLQLWNDTYLRIYRLPREEIFVGCDLEHL